MTGDVFGDYEPEDAYDAGDRVPALLRNLDRRAEALGEPSLLDAVADDRARLRELVERVAALRARRASPVLGDNVRLLLLTKHVEHVARRLREQR